MDEFKYFFISHWLFSFDFVASLLSSEKKQIMTKALRKTKKVMKMLDYQNEMLTFPNFSVSSRRDFPK